MRLQFTQQRRSRIRAAIIDVYNLEIQRNSLKHRHQPAVCLPQYFLFVHAGNHHGEEHPPLTRKGRTDLCRPSRALQEWLAHIHSFRPSAADPPIALADIAAFRFTNKTLTSSEYS